MTTQLEWPKHPDGRPKKMGELTQSEQQAQFEQAVNALKPEFSRLGIKLRLKSDLS